MAIITTISLDSRASVFFQHSELLITFPLVAVIVSGHNIKKQRHLKPIPTPAAVIATSCHLNTSMLPPAFSCFPFNTGKVKCSFALDLHVDSDIGRERSSVWRQRVSA